MVIETSQVYNRIKVDKILDYANYGTSEFFRGTITDLFNGSSLLFLNNFELIPLDHETYLINSSTGLLTSILKVNTDGLEKTDFHPTYLHPAFKITDFLSSFNRIIICDDDKEYLVNYDGEKLSAGYDSMENKYGKITVTNNNDDGQILVGEIDIDGNLTQSGMRPITVEDLLPKKPIFMEEQMPPKLSRKKIK